MANTVDVQKLVDGERNAIFRVYVASDGVAGDLSDEVIVDLSTLNGSPDNVRLDKIQAHFAGFIGVLEWDATTDDEILTIPDGDMIDFHYKRGGGLINPRSTGYTGDLTLSTTGFTASGDEGSIYLECTKRYS